MRCRFVSLPGAEKEHASGAVAAVPAIGRLTCSRYRTMGIATARNATENSIAHDGGEGSIDPRAIFQCPTASHVRLPTSATIVSSSVNTISGVQRVELSHDIDPASTSSHASTPPAPAHASIVRTPQTLPSMTLSLIPPLPHPAPPAHPHRDLSIPLRLTLLLTVLPPDQALAAVPRPGRPVPSDHPISRGFV